MNKIAHSPHAHAPVSISKVMATVLLALTLHAVRFLVVRLASDQPVGGIADRRHRRRSFRRAATRPCRAPGVDGWLRNFDGLAAGHLPAAVRTLVDRGAGQSVRVIIGKQVFGGLGQNPFNPAMAARVMLLISFPLEMTTWVAPASLVRRRLLVGWKVCASLS